MEREGGGGAGRAVRAPWATASSYSSCASSLALTTPTTLRPSMTASNPHTAALSSTGNLGGQGEHRRVRSVDVKHSPATQVSRTRLRPQLEKQPLA